MAHGSDYATDAFLQTQLTGPVWVSGAVATLLSFPAKLALFVNA